MKRLKAPLLQGSLIIFDGTAKKRKIDALERKTQINRITKIVLFR